MQLKRCLINTLALRDFDLFISLLDTFTTPYQLLWLCSNELGDRGIENEEQGGSEDIIKTDSVPGLRNGEQ